MQAQWTPPYVHTAVPGQLVLQGGWLAGQSADWTQVQVEPVPAPASAFTEQPQTMWKAGFELG